MSFIRRIKRGKVTYLAEVENKRVDGKVIQKHIRYIGKEENGETVISMSSSDLEIKKVKVYGPLLVLDKIAREIDLQKSLGQYSNEILSMVYAHCLDYKSLRKMPKWYERTDLNTLLNLEDLTESRLLSALDSLESDPENLQKKIFQGVQKRYNLELKGLVYDVTNTYLYGSKCQLGKLGKSKDGKRGNPLIQIGLVTTQKEGIPVFHKTFSGNIHDSRTLLSLSDGFANYGLSGGMFVYDRGIFSERNLNEINELGWNTLCGIALRKKEKDLIRKMIRLDSIVDVSHRIRLSSGTLYAQSINHNVGKIKGRLVVCYNQRRALDIRESRLDEIANAQILLSKNKNIKPGLEKYLTPTGRLRRDRLNLESEFDGYSCIFSTKKISAKDIVNLYYKKEVIEKFFRTLKGITNLRPIRHWLYNRVQSHVFICYLSCLILSILKMKLEKMQMSPEEALEELGSMYNVYLYDRKNKTRLIKTVALNKVQEKILRSIGKSLVKKTSVCSVHF